MERLKNLLISNKLQARLRESDDEESEYEEFESSWVELDSGNASDSSSESGALSSSAISSPLLSSSSSNSASSPMMLSHLNHSQATMNHNIASSPMIGNSSNSPLPSSSVGSSYSSFFSNIIGGGASFSIGTIGSPKLDFLRSKRRQRKKIRGKDGSDSECSSPSLSWSPFSSPMLSHHNSNNNGPKALTSFHLFSELPLELRVYPLQWLTVSELATAALVCKDWSYEISRSHSLWKGKFHKIKTTNEPPVRVCHGALSYKDSLYVYGGHVPSDQGDFITSVRSDLWEYNLNTHHWKRMCNFEPLTETSPILYKDKMYIFGGFINSWRTSTIIEYDFNTRKYIKMTSEEENPSTVGAPPKGRSAYSAVVYKNCMYIYGGWDGHESMNDIHCFNLDTKQWVQQPEQPQDCVAPCVRSHSAWVWNDAMYVWGGYGQNGHPVELYRYDFLEEDPAKRWTKVNAKGTPPCGRSRMKCLLSENRVFLLGGWDRKTLLGDFWEFNMETLTWKQMKQTGLPKGISQYSLTMHQNQMVVFGGCAEGASTNSLYGFKVFDTQSQS